MIRALHRWLGLPALVLVTLLAVSGAALSIFPAAERISAPQAEQAISVADLSARIKSVFSEVEQIRRSPSGRITAYWFDGGAPADGDAGSPPSGGLWRGASMSSLRGRRSSAFCCRRQRPSG